MVKSFQEHSRTKWQDSRRETPTMEQIQLGCVQRIAAATEAMAKNHNDLIEENRWLRTTRADYRNKSENLKRRLSAMKGVNTKLKKRLAVLEAELEVKAVIENDEQAEVNTEIDWDSLPDWVRFAAMDYDGEWRGYQFYPYEAHNSWSVISGNSLPIKTVPPSSEIHWTKTLQERPQ